MKLRKNLKGSMAYRSFIPPKISEYEINIGHDVIRRLTEKFTALNDLLKNLDEKTVAELIDMESKDSWLLAEDRHISQFSLFSLTDNENVRNIIVATDYGREALADLPISTRLIRNIHYLICKGPDYDKKYRGEYRISPVWIGERGKGIAEATFVPPVDEDLTAAIVDLEHYINCADENVFVKAAVIHYQFEMLHPFIDGNGRTGRLLNNLFLYESKVVAAPALLLSHIIARDYKRYCDEIQYINETGDMTQWVKYWTGVLDESADYTSRIIKN